MEPSPLIRLRGVSKFYPSPAGPVAALQDLDLDIRAGRFLAIVGASGSGKTSLLNLLGGIDRANGGELQVAGTDLQALSERELCRWRGQHIGFVFQFFQLMPTLTVLENVQLPMDLAQRLPRKERSERAHALLQRLGVADQANKWPGQLSGGQQQRVAVARALANQAPLLLADEPTGNLDSRNAASLLALLAELVAEQGVTVLMVTHERQALAAVQQQIELRDGRLV
ncbi:putative ABC transport system ATP-binding protein [Inhella inkyongensis]|uniref:Putative ABC transport system ATP-binding protein n=1 Tax=Inhella inkyongensis TaxID=392593 RepID=A0A840RW77_9BURK|nr:ABC transporter ATP-binding protein [Inhella inkyongensis]MBB5202927.1 putative ABC transport system ATP-binding protein [Inhella inkyongensis]